jgi:elongation factor Ts
MSNIEILKKIRAQTGLPLKDINKAIEAVGANDEQKLITYLREQGVLKQQSRQDRETANGGIFAYSHDGRLGVLLELKCETDFVARSDAFRELGNDLTLHIAAFQPQFVSPEEVDQEFIEKELEIARKQLQAEGKPEDKLNMILEGKKKKISEEFSLLTQPYIKDTKMTVSEAVSQAVQATGEKIEVARFTIYNLNA